MQNKTEVGYIIKTDEKHYQHSIRYMIQISDDGNFVEVTKEYNGKNVEVYTLGVIKR